MQTRKVFCFKCRRCVGFKADDSEATPPIYCLPCEPAVLAEREQWTRDAEADALR